MSLLHKIGSFLWRCWFVLISIFATLFVGVLLVLPFSFNPKHFRIAYFFERIWAKVIFFGSGLSLKKHDFQKINAAHPYVVIANHTSMMDIMLMFILNEKPMVFVGKRELLNLPVFGYIFKRLNITVDRSNPGSRIQVFREAKKCIAEGKSICIFPEGGVPDEEIFLKEFLEGPFAIAIMNKVSLITMTFCGMKKILPYAYFRGKPGRVDVFLNQILDTERLNKNHIEEVKETSYELIYKTLQKCEKHA